MIFFAINKKTLYGDFICMPGADGGASKGRKKIVSEQGHKEKLTGNLPEEWREQFCRAAIHKICAAATTYHIGDVLPDGWIVGPVSPHTLKPIAIEPVSGALEDCWTWFKGEEHAKALRQQGHANARQPSTKELSAIYNDVMRAGRNGNAKLATSRFDLYGGYWSSTTLSDAPDYAWVKYLDSDGRTWHLKNYSFCRVRCVRDEPGVTIERAADGHLVISIPGTVLTRPSAANDTAKAAPQIGDLDDGGIYVGLSAEDGRPLHAALADLPEYKTYEEALAAAEQLKTAHPTAHVPTPKELAKNLFDNRFTGHLKGTFNTSGSNPGSVYRSSASYSYDNARVQWFDDGSQYGSIRYYRLPVRLVW
ncbi:MAG: hypothetical protein WA517_22835 [Candidatus Acidiferrum sp.]